MGLFSKRTKKERNAEWSIEAWRGLVSSVSKTADMYCERFGAAVASERASAAAHAAAADHSRARAAAELALRNRAKVRALARLATLADQLHARDLGIASLSSLEQLREPARTEVVSFIYAAGRLSVQPLTEAVAMLRAIFPDDVDDITRAKHAWPDRFDTRLYDALTPGPADDDLVDKELAAAANDYPEYSGSGGASSSAANAFPEVTPTTSGQATGTYHDVTPAGTQPPPQTASPTLAVPGEYSHRSPIPSPTYGITSRGPSGQIPSAPPRATTMAHLTRPWEAGERPRVPAGLLQHPVGVMPPPPPPQNDGQIPDYYRKFQDSDEALQRRYQDLLRG